MYLTISSADALLILQMFVEITFTHLSHDFILLFWLKSKAREKHLTI